MRFKHTLLAFVIGLPASSASGVTLEELAARLELLENKLQKYESRYGPLKTPKQETISMPESSGTRSSVVAAPSEGSSIDNAFLENPGGNRWYEKTTIGGYGELHLNTGDKDQIDFHRWVLFVNHRFNDRIKLFSEFELEHSLSGDGKPGEVELEQAYIEFDLDQGLSAKAGVYLLPLGFLNETHEPDTFYGVERNNVEKNIIPTTWWEGGAAVSKSFDSGLGFDFGVHSGLNVPTAGSKAFSIRSGRQKVAEADATNWAASARVRYAGGNGLSVSGFANFQSDIANGSAEDNSALLLGAAAQYNSGGFGLRALVSHWNIDGASFEAADADKQWGYFVEPSYRWSFENGGSVGIFGRYSSYEYASGTRKEVDEYTVGVNYWPIDNVVLKADYNVLKEDGKSDNNTFNFGVGYSF